MDQNINILVETLIRGTKSAKKLQNLLNQKGNYDGSVSINDLAMEIAKSLAEGLSVLNSCGFGEICDPRVGLACSSDQQSEVITRNGEKIFTPLAKKGKGHYPRRKNEKSNVKVSDTTEDGYVWRKYGQKDILKSKFPRCYYRCSHKDDHGCMAVKQVQQLEGKSNKFHIKYFGSHTCPTLTLTPTTQHVVSHNPGAAEPGLLLDFEAFKNHGHLASKPATTKTTHIKLSKKRKVPSNKVSPPNVSISSSTNSVSNDKLLDDFSPRTEPSLTPYGEYFSPLIPSSDLFPANFSEHEILGYDDMMLIGESLWNYEDIELNGMYNL